MKFLSLMLVVCSFASFAQTFRGSNESSNFRDELKCKIVGLDYNHYLLIGLNADHNSYFVGETTNLNKENPYADYQVVESYVAAESQSYSNVNYRTDDTHFYTDWKFRGNNFSLSVRLSNETKTAVRVSFNSKLNSSITKYAGNKVLCEYAR